MSDLISREDFLDLFYVRAMGQDKAFILAVEECLKDCPSITPEEGEWILDSDPGEPWRYKCSCCGEKTKDTCMGKPRANFCPNCGVDMRGRKEDK